MLENTFSIETVKCSRFYSFYSVLTEDGRYSYFCFSNVLVSLFSPRFYFTLCVLRLSLLWFCFALILCCYMRFMIIEYFPIQWNHFVRIVLPYFQRSGGFAWLLFFFFFWYSCEKAKSSSSTSCLRVCHSSTSRPYKWCHFIHAHQKNKAKQNNNNKNWNCFTN